MSALGPEDLSCTRRWPFSQGDRGCARVRGGADGLPRRGRPHVRIGRHSTARLAVVAAASLVLAQLDEGVGHSRPHLGGEGGVVGGPVGQEGPGLGLLAGAPHRARV
jgi:hypothetical protein